MKARIVCLVLSGLAVGTVSSVCQEAKAGDYFAIVSPPSTMVQKSDYVSRRSVSYPVFSQRSGSSHLVERVTSYPVVVEGTASTSTMMLDSIPVLYEKTTTVKPHHFPFSFGVWP